MTPLLTVTIIFTGLWVMIGVTVWQLRATKRAAVEAAASQAYRELAESTAAAQSLASAELAQVRDRLVAIEKLLSDVG